MRMVIFGAGAVGSVIGGRLFQHQAAHGHQITLVARSSHCDAIRANGLTINDPSGTVSLAVPVVEHISQIEMTSDDVVILTMKTQDTAAALEQLARHAPIGVKVACAQNGVENERLALRRFGSVYGICVLLPAMYVDPGVVDASGAPNNAILDVGRYPDGTDSVSDVLARAFALSNLTGRSIPDVMRWKYTKLMLNLGNAADALVSDTDHVELLVGPARAEAEACLLAAGIDKVAIADDRARRTGVMEVLPIPGSSRGRGGGSTWQSLARGAARTEVDWLNGEIVLLGRTHGVPIPINELLCDVARWAAVTGAPPRSLTVEQILGRRW